MNGKDAPPVKDIVVWRTVYEHSFMRWAARREGAPWETWGWGYTEKAAIDDLLYHEKHDGLKG